MHTPEVSSRVPQADAGVVYFDWESRELFERTLGFATSHGLLLWADAGGMRFAGREEGEEGEPPSHA
jgi:hypothetical protein